MIRKYFPSKSVFSPISETKKEVNTKEVNGSKVAKQDRAPGVDEDEDKKPHESKAEEAKGAKPIASRPIVGTGTLV